MPHKDKCPLHKGTIVFLLFLYAEASKRSDNGARKKKIRHNQAKNHLFY
jgi:hypothetical protein